MQLLTACFSVRLPLISVFTALCRGIIDGVRIRTVLLMSVLLGMVSFIAYFTKEVAAAFVISEIAMLAVAHLIVGGRKGNLFSPLRQQR